MYIFLFCASCFEEKLHIPVSFQAFMRETSVKTISIKEKPCMSLIRPYSDMDQKGIRVWWINNCRCSACTQPPIFRKGAYYGTIDKLGLQALMTKR